MIGHGINVSERNGQIDWPRVKNTGIEFVMAYATDGWQGDRILSSGFVSSIFQGANYRDPKFEYNFIEMAANNFKLIGACHIFRVLPTDPSIEEQMQNIISTLKAVEFDEKRNFLAIDIKQYDNLGEPTPELKLAITKKFAEFFVCLHMHKYDIFLHTNCAFWNNYIAYENKAYNRFHELPIFVSDFASSSEPELPVNWRKWHAWHYTNQGSVEGMTGKVDMNFVKVMEVFESLNLLKSLSNKPTRVEYSLGINVSQRNGLIDWTSVYDDGIKFAIAKATEGTNHRDPRFEDNFIEMCANGIKVIGAYHSFDYTSSAEAQADNIDSALNAVDFDKGHHFLAIELKEDIHLGEPTPELRQEISEKFEHLMVNLCTRGYKYKILYTNRAFWNKYINYNHPKYNGFHNMVLWMAHSTPTEPRLPGNWREWHIFQYSNEGTVSGIDGKVDMNWVKDI